MVIRNSFFILPAGKLTRYLLFTTLLWCIAFTGCKKNGTSSDDSAPEIISLTLNNGAISTRSKDRKEVQVYIADYIDRKALVAVFQLSSGTTAKVNGIEQKSSDTPNDFTFPVVYELTKNGKTVNWTVKVESNTYNIGLGNVVEADKRLTREYEWYQSQDTTGVYSAINGGATCLAMALHWASQLEFTGINTLMVRKEAEASPTNMMSSIDMGNYLSRKRIDWRLVTLSQDYTEVTDAIDKGHLVIINADMSFIPFNAFHNQHVNRFYTQIPSFRGHYFIVKGYKRVDGFLFYEVYDPYTLSQRYEDNGEIKGRNRYYYSEAVRKGAYGAHGWKYAFVIHEKRNGNNTFGAIGTLKNEVSPEQTKILMNPLQILYNFGY